VVLAILVVLFDILILAFRLVPKKFSRPPGGMDGCLVSGSGMPGIRQFRVQTSVGTLFKQMVTIKSGQAVALGTVKIGP
jgi:hypothetical protein